ncbi:28S ribosomal protein S5, mitochondrial isoform X2 [Ischnura elegans]|uniref:28S ribosomal protein S5, mitochondrial isoform X2 n=1 Tax=Ischnura elegans TaxID=197161 RepID=UPI001ED89EAE|nr:28S ribosomal protein S5, mitochondrial isoform X2 [Ischnura elegans]
MPAEQLWKGVTSVSNAGKKRGRGKGMGRKTAKNLNRGQVIGIGKANIVWPGLNAPILRGRELVQQQKLPEDPERQQKLLKMRDEMGTFRSLKLSPTERGWSGNRMPGRSIGPPDPIGEDKFEGFDTKVLEMKTVFNMRGNLGRTRRMSVMVVTGNKQGLAGFALGKAVDGRVALTQAKNRAGQKLLFYDICDNHTVYHDFFSQFGKTKVFVKKKPEGYGLICHRAIKTICEVLGIKNLHAKVEGSTNLQHIVKAFFIGLLKQKTYQQIAEEKGLHVVEIRKDRDNFPSVVASPTKCLTEEEIDRDNLDYTQHGLDGRVVLQKKKFPIFYTQLPSYQKYLNRMERFRGQPKTRIHLLAEYGEVRSFLADKYPECVAPKFQKVKSDEAAAEQ